MLDNLKKYKVILASNSPRRKELLAGLGVDYEVRTLPDVDESYPDTLQGADIKPGIEIVLNAVNLAQAVQGAALVITGEGHSGHPCRQHAHRGLRTCPTANSGCR